MNGWKDGQKFRFLEIFATGLESMAIWNPELFNRLTEFSAMNTYFILGKEESYKNNIFKVKIICPTFCSNNYKLGLCTLKMTVLCQLSIGRGR